MNKKTLKKGFKKGWGGFKRKYYLVDRIVYFVMSKFLPTLINYSKKLLNFLSTKKVFLQNTLISLLILPFILIAYIFVIVAKISVNNEYNDLFSAILAIFFLDNCILLIVSILYISLFEKTIRKVFSLISAVIIALAFIYPLVYIEKGSQELGFGIAINIIFVAFATSYFIAIGCRKLYNYIFKSKNKEDITNKLSFINKILLGIITLTGSIISLILTFQKLFQ
ncbi:hypothetical protein HNO90_001473 [Staphylococcus hominis]|uniref:hypothetical protein n=1 Tax=Staphylococcus hominis TaxID=1290 RepID=UPI0016090FD5|nr:hypothetical protein [Staphylococcus hominis]MBB4833082.1 hypothetical protein [Staphylococcus hominis]